VKVTNCLDCPLHTNRYVHSQASEISCNIEENKIVGMVKVSMSQERDWSKPPNWCKLKKKGSITIEFEG